VARSEGSEYARQKHHKRQLSECHKGRFGQKYLASGIRISMRLWEREQPAEAKLQTAHEYETAGFVIEGKAELHPWCARFPMPGRWTSQASRNANAATKM